MFYELKSELKSFIYQSSQTKAVPSPAFMVFTDISIHTEVKSEKKNIINTHLRLSCSSPACETEGFNQIKKSIETHKPSE